MKTISLNFTWTVLGFLMLILLTPSLAAAAENDSNLPLQIEVNVLNDNPEKAPILDVEAKELLGIDNIDLEIPNTNDMQSSSDEGNAEEKLVKISVEDEKIGNLEADVLSHTEFDGSSEKAAVVDITTEDLVVADNVDIEVLGQEESLTETSYSSKSAVVDITTEDLVVADELGIEVLGQEETSTETAYSSESAVVDITTEDLVVADDAEIEVLGQEESLTETAYSSKSAVVDMTTEDLVVADEVDIEVLGQEESATETAYSSKSAVVDMTTEDLVVADDVDIEVLGQEESLTETAFSSEAAVVDAELAPSIIVDQLELDVLTDKKHITKDGTTEEMMNMEEGIHLELTNVPVVDAAHVGVLENQTSTSNEGYTESSSLLNVKTGDENSDSLLDNLELNVLPMSDSMEAELEQSSSSVVSLETTDGLLGDLSADVLLSRWASDESSNMYDSGVVELVSEQFPITDQMHLGILDHHEMHSIDEQYSNGGVLQLDVLSDQLDQLTVDVLTNDYYTNNDGTSRINHGVSLGVNNDLLQNTTVQILGNEEFVAAQPIVSPNNPDESEGSATEDGEGNTGETPMENETSALVDEDGEEVYADASGSESSNEDTNTETNENINTEVTADDGINENATNNEEEQDDASLFGNLNDVSLNGNGMQDSSMLPKTGGFFDSMLLMLLALSLLASGLTIRKFA